MTLRQNLELKEAIRQTQAAAAAVPDDDHLPKFNQAQAQARQAEAAEVTLWNVMSGLLAILTRSAQPKILLPTASSPSPSPSPSGGKKDEEEEDDGWRSVLLPSAPPFSSMAVVDHPGVKAVIEAEAPQWLPDSSAVACMQCSASFRAVTCGRHHCRFCGGIFCRSCTRGRCLLPVRFREREPQRVCDSCYDRLQPIQRRLLQRVSNASQLATHDVTDLSCIRSWINTPWGLSMEQEIYKATNALRSYAKIGKLKPERAIPDAVWRGAKGLAVLTVVKAGFIVTYKIGTGLVVARGSDGTWSGPSAIACAGWGYGAQLGGELADLVIVLRSEEAVKAFSGRLHFSIGAELTAAAGPVGRKVEAELRAGDGGAAACYSYSLSKGAFVGLSIEGSVVTRRSDTNARFYGDSYMTSADILSQTYPPPRAAAPLYQALQDIFDDHQAPE